MRLKLAAIGIQIAALVGSGQALRALPTYTIEQAVAVAEEHNPDIQIARKKVQGARGGVIEARSGIFPWLSSDGLADKPQKQNETNLRPADYNRTLNIQTNLSTGTPGTAK